MLPSTGGLTFDPVTMDEIADRLRIEPIMVETLYRFDNNFPHPCWIVDGWPFWEWFGVEAWARKLVVR